MSAPTLRTDHADATVATPVVVGIDPSLTGTGIASSDGWCELRGYTKARAKDPGLTQLPHLQRHEEMAKLARSILDVVGRPDLAVIEAPAFTRSGGGAHERAWLWWELFGALAGRQVPVAVMTPGQRIQYATGKGAGPKGAVIDAASRRWPQYATGGNDNLADAVVLMAAGRDALGYALCPVPQTHHRALGAVRWPRIGGVS